MKDYILYDKILINGRKRNIYKKNLKAKTIYIRKNNEMVRFKMPENHDKRDKKLVERKSTSTRLKKNKIHGNGLLHRISNFFSKPKENKQTIEDTEKKDYYVLYNEKDKTYMFHKIENKQILANGSILYSYKIAIEKINKDTDLNNIKWMSNKINNADSQKLYIELFFESSENNNKYYYNNTNSNSVHLSSYENDNIDRLYNKYELTNKNIYVSYQENRETIKFLLRKYDDKKDIYIKPNLSKKITSNYTPIVIYVDNNDNILVYYVEKETNVTTAEYYVEKETNTRTEKIINKIIKEKNIYYDNNVNNLDYTVDKNVFYFDTKNNMYAFINNELVQIYYHKNDNNSYLSFDNLNMNQTYQIYSQFTLDKNNNKIKIKDNEYITYKIEEIVDNRNYGSSKKNKELYYKDVSDCFDRS
jgi:hypothetical protein